MANKWETARTRLMLRHRFLAMALCLVPQHEDYSEPTACTNMKAIFYNPNFVEALPVSVVLFVMVHEIMHIILKHGLRRGSREHDTWNIACDYAVNGLLRKAGFAMWDQCCDHECFDGWSAERIYDHIVEHGEPRGGQPEDGDGIGDDLKPPPSAAPEAEAEIERKIDAMIAQAAIAAQGDVPGAMKFIVEGLMQPKMPWRDLLREFMTRNLPTQETWDRRNFRFMQFYFPTMAGKRMGEVVIIGDTSMSMPQRVFDQTGAELGDIMTQVKPERIRVIWADAKDCNLMEVFEYGEELKLNPQGRGGTDMRLPLKFVEQFNPIVVVLITDGDSPWPESVPYPLIVLTTRNTNIPIGSVIKLEGIN